MTDTIITVRAEHTARHAAERAVVDAGVHASGKRRDDALGRARTAAAAMRELIEARSPGDAGAIASWTSDDVRVWADRPRGRDGQQQPPVFNAAQSFTVTFRDFDDLARWVETAAEIPDAVIASIGWELTEATRASALAEVRTRAVQDAVAKATEFARAAGLGDVRVVAIADPGMLGDRGHDGGGGGYPGVMMARSAFTDGAPALAIKPEEIAVAATVDARFVAS